MPCPEARTLKCRGREPAGWFPRAPTGSGVAPAWKNLPRPRAASGLQVQKPHEWWKAQRGQRLIDVSQNATLLIYNKKSTQVDVHAHVSLAGILCLKQVTWEAKLSSWSLVI